MSIGDFLSLATLAGSVLVVTPLLGRYIHRVMEGERTFLSPVLGPVERAVYRVCVPVDLVTTSASGLDPDISPAAAEYQVPRVTATRNVSEADVRAAVARHTEGLVLGFLGQPRVNVLLLNLDLDGMLR